MSQKFPIRLAAIDIGTNSFHIIVAEIENKKLKIIDRQRKFLRLGSDSGSNLSHISDSEIEKAISILKSFSSLAEYHKASIKAVSTSAVREADNKYEFIQKVFNETGIVIEIIDGIAEANLIFLGMKNALEINDKKILGIDIGGGSTEFIYGVNGSPVFAESIKIGAVRLSKMFFPNLIISEERIKDCSDYVEQQIKSKKNINTNIKIDFAIGSSGTVDTICMMINFRLNNLINKQINGCYFSDKEFYDTYNRLMLLKTPEERLQIPGFEKNRADIIPAGLIILKKIFEMFNIKEMKHSEYALREGVIYDMIDKL